MSVPMVQAIIAGRKRKTRRIVKPMKGKQSEWLTDELILQSPKLTICRSHEGDGYGDLGAQMEHPKGGPLGWVRCPYGKPGDILWVRESHRFTGGGFVSKPDYSVLTPRDFIFKADEDWNGPWRPSIHMPKEAARIWLEVTEVRVERLQDISNEDAIAEGVNHGDQSPKSIGGAIATMVLDARSEFFSLWTKINGEDSLDSNPWVWCITFKVLSTTGRPHFLNV